LLPNEYNNGEWLPFLRFLGLRVDTSREDTLCLARLFEKKFQTGRLSLEELERLARLLLAKLPSLSSRLLDEIKIVEFIPSYFAGLASNSIHQKLFDPRQQSVCLADSYFKEDLDFVWTTKSILPDYCRSVECLVPSVLSCTTLVDSFIRILEVCSRDGFIRGLSALHCSQLNVIFLKYYDKLQEALSDDSNHSQVRRLEGLRWLWNERNGEVCLDSATRFYTSLSQEDAVPPYILSLPSIYQKYSQLTDLLGCNREVTLEACIVAMEGLKSAAGDQLTPQGFNGALNLYKTLLFDDLLCKDSCEAGIEFYAPNADGVVHKLSELYYDVDDPELFNFLRKKKRAALNLIFDFEKLRSRQLKRGAALSEMNSWARVFRTLPFFVRNRQLAPRPITSLIERRLVGSYMERDTRLSLILRWRLGHLMILLGIKFNKSVF